MRELLLTRHAESEFNASGRINADPSIPCALTERGRGQAEALAEIIAGEAIDLCVTSEHERAIETADIALDGREVPRFVIADFNEPKAGALEGGLASDYAARVRRDGPASPNPGGESQIDALRRYVRAHRALVRREEPTILVVAHGLPIGWLRSAIACCEGRVDQPAVDFADPGVPFAGAPDRLCVDELPEALSVLERHVAAFGDLS